MARRVLITGVARHLGGRLAQILAASPDVEVVVGVDTTAPRGDLGRTEFVRADIRNPIIAKVLSTERIDTVVHMNLIATPERAGGRTAMKEINVIGTMQLLAACQKAPLVRRLIVKSSTAVYGSSSRDPALFTEESPLRGGAVRVRQGRRRGRGLRARLRPAPSRCGADRAALHQLHRPAPGQLAHPLPVAAGGADRARVRPAHPALPRGRRAGGAPDRRAHRPRRHRQRRR